MEGGGEFTGPVHACGLCDRGIVAPIFAHREWKLRVTIHAEMRALMQVASGDDVMLYVTHPPCSRCVAHMLEVPNCRVRGIITEVSKRNQDYRKRWQTDICEGTTLALQGGLIYTVIDEDGQVVYSADAF